MSDREQPPAAQRHWAAGHWLTGRVLDPLYEINGQCVELLCHMASAALPHSRPAPLLRDLAPLWRRLTDEGRSQVAASPFLLVDAGFADEARWRNLLQAGVHDLPRDPRAAFFQGQRASAFARRVLVYGWHLARAHRSVARLMLGMTPASLSYIAQLNLRDLDRVCEQHPGWLRPRWEAQPDVWRQLLAAAIAGDDAALQLARLRGIQLLGAGAFTAPAAVADPDPWRAMAGTRGSA